MYTTKDYLGNIRVNYSLEKGSLVILDEHHYYPFGLEHGAYNPIRKEYRKAEDGVNNDIVVITDVENSGYQYKYNAKELQDELDLNVYDYGARMYDPATPRFW